MKMLRFTDDGLAKPTKNGFYLVKTPSYTESGYCIAEWNNITKEFHCEVSGEIINEEISMYSKELINE